MNLIFNTGKYLSRTISVTGLLLFVCVMMCLEAFCNDTDERVNRPNSSKDSIVQFIPNGIFLANHKQGTGIEDWKIERWRIGIQDIKKMGANTIFYLPIQFGQHPIADFDDNSEFWILQKSICKEIHDAGLKVGIYIGYNDVFPESIKEHPEWIATYGKYGMEENHACMKAEGAQDYIDGLRKKVFKDLQYIDFIISPITDYGGCSCNKCSPLPPTYLASYKKMVDLCKYYHPGVKVIAAGHGLDVGEEDMLRNLLKEISWVDYVADIPKGVKPIIKYYMYPEITMLDSWGYYGTCPKLKIIKQAFTEDNTRFFGSVIYSEGIHDDVNKFAVLQYAKNCSLTTFEVARKYAVDWLGVNKKDADDVADVILGLGTPICKNFTYLDYRHDIISNRKADKRLITLISLRKKNPSLVENYRYWLLLYRAVYESFSVCKGELSLDELNKEIILARKELSRLEPEYGKHLNAMMRWDKPEISPWNWARSFNNLWNRENEFEKKY